MTYYVTVAGNDSLTDPAAGTLREAKREVDEYPQGGPIEIVAGINPVLIAPLYPTNPLTVKGDSNNVITVAPGQPVAIVGTAPVTFSNVTFVTSGGAPAITATGQIDLEGCTLVGGGLVSTVTVACTVTVNDCAFEDIPSTAGPAATLTESAGDTVNFTGNVITACADAQVYYAGANTSLLNFSNNLITNNNVVTEAAANFFSGPVNATDDVILNNTYAGPIGGFVISQNTTDSFNTLSVNGNHVATPAAPTTSALIFQNNGGTLTDENTTAAFNTVAGGAMIGVQGTGAASFEKIGIAENTCGGLYAAASIPITVYDAIFNYNAGFGGLYGTLTTSSGYLDCGVLVGSSYPPNSTNANAEVDGCLNGLTLQFSLSSPMRTFAAPLGSEYLGDRSTFA